MTYISVWPHSFGIFGVLSINNPKLHFATSFCLFMVSFALGALASYHIIQQFKIDVEGGLWKNIILKALVFLGATIVMVFVMVGGVILASHLYYSDW